MIVSCPHCGGSIVIEAINCGIFRHAIYKTGALFPPHAPKTLCDSAFTQGIIYGCGKPFRIVDNKAIVCEYV